jgi:hypothetical protein
LDFGFWILDFGFWILDFGFWIGKTLPGLDFRIKLYYFLPSHLSQKPGFLKKPGFLVEIEV